MACGLTVAGCVAPTHRLIGELGWQRAGRRLGIRIDVDRAPTRDELAGAARREGLSAFELHLDRVRQSGVVDTAALSPTRRMSMSASTDRSCGGFAR